MLQFHYIVLSEQICGSSTGQGQKASVERRLALLLFRPSGSN
jgi:hypothetical protein